MCTGTKIFQKKKWILINFGYILDDFSYLYTFVKII